MSVCWIACWSVGWFFIISYTYAPNGAIGSIVGKFCSCLQNLNLSTSVTGPWRVYSYTKPKQEKKRGEDRISPCGEQKPAKAMKNEEQNGQKRLKMLKSIHTERKSFWLQLRSVSKIGNSNNLHIRN